MAIRRFDPAEPSKLPFFCFNAAGKRDRRHVAKVVGGFPSRKLGTAWIGAPASAIAEKASSLDGWGAKPWLHFVNAQKNMTRWSTSSL